MNTSISLDLIIKDSVVNNVLICLDSTPNWVSWYKSHPLIGKSINFKKSNYKQKNKFEIISIIIIIIILIKIILLLF